MRRWKLSDTDLYARSRWVDYSRAKDEMFVHTDIPEAPWFVVEADNKKRARLNCIAHLLSRIPWEPKPEPKIELPPRQSRRRLRPAAERPVHVRAGSRRGAAALGDHTRSSTTSATLLRIPVTNGTSTFT